MTPTFKLKGKAMKHLFDQAVSRKDAKEAFRLLYSAKEHEVVSCLISLGVNDFYGTKEKTISINQQAVINACS